MPPADSQAPTPSWDDLRVFLAILREGTFAAAGRRIGVNATTAARRLASLEASVGAQLFSRTRDGLVPTAAAERMREAGLTVVDGGSLEDMAAAGYPMD